MVLKKRTTSTHALREKAISEFHDLLVADQTLSPIVFEKLRSAMRKKRLLYGERPIGVALRPHLLHHKQFQKLSQAAQHVTSALEKIATAVVQDPNLMEELGLTEAERRMALIDPGFSTAGVTTRLDAFVRGDEIKFVESNAENPSSLPDQEELNRLLFELPVMASFARRYRLRQFSPVERLLETLLSTYREWGGSGVPNIAILDWKGVPTSSEFVFLQEHFAARGVRTIICSPDDLEYEQGQLRCGAFRIDLVYKRVIIHEFLARHDDTHPLIRAYVNHDVCLVNPFRCKIMHKKAVFEVLTDEQHQDWFTSSEKETIRRTVPWTRRVSDRKTSRKGRKINLLDFIRRNRSHLVLKPNDDYGGHGIHFGAQLDEREWENAIESAVSGDYIVQDALDLHPEVFPVFTENDWKLQPMFVDTNPFLFRGKVCGAMVRLSTTPIVNVTSGGGETGFFVIHD
ncbi:MAG: glutathionylspermidine synthase family protein [Nitrospirota bacterium]|jgi:glutathionylspermidine synthase